MAASDNVVPLPTASNLAAPSDQRDPDLPKRIEQAVERVKMDFALVVGQRPKDDALVILMGRKTFLDFMRALPPLHWLSHGCPYSGWVKRYGGARIEICEDMKGFEIVIATGEREVHRRA